MIKIALFFEKLVKLMVLSQSNKRYVNLKIKLNYFYF